MLPALSREQDKLQVRWKKDNPHKAGKLLDESNFDELEDGTADFLGSAARAKGRGMQHYAKRSLISSGKNAVSEKAGEIAEKISEHTGLGDAAKELSSGGMFKGLPKFPGLGRLRKAASRFTEDLDVKSVAEEKVKKRISKMEKKEEHKAMVQSADMMDHLDAHRITNQPLNKYSPQNLSNDLPERWFGLEPPKKPGVEDIAGLLDERLVVRTKRTFGDRVYSAGKKLSFQAHAASINLSAAASRAGEHLRSNANWAMSSIRKRVYGPSAPPVRSFKAASAPSLPPRPSSAAPPLPPRPQARPTRE